MLTHWQHNAEHIESQLDGTGNLPMESRQLISSVLSTVHLQELGLMFGRSVMLGRSVQLVTASERSGQLR